MVVPDYGGGSIANLPATIGRLLGIEAGWVAPPLAGFEPRSAPVERVALLLVDGLGWNRLQDQLRWNDAGFGELSQRFGIDRLRLTSVAPSTTSVATTVLTGNGAAPAETGMLGFTALLPELGLVANLLFWQPAWHPAARNGELENWGIRPERFLPTPSLAQVLARHEVETRVLMPRSYAHSPLSRMQFRGAEVTGYHSVVEMWLLLEELLVTPGGSELIYAYFPDFDAVSHRHGPEGGYWEALWASFTFDLAACLERLGQSRVGGRTLLLITADHGHVSCPPEKRVYLDDHPLLLDGSLVMPAGEPRHLYLYPRDGAKKSMLAYAREQLGHAVVALDGEEALNAGLYGDPQRRHPDAHRRLGGVVLLARGGHSLWFRPVERPMLGMHGGLEPDEMFVPLFTVELG